MTNHMHAHAIVTSIGSVYFRVYDGTPDATTLIGNYSFANWNHLVGYFGIFLSCVPLRVYSAE